MNSETLQTSKATLTVTELNTQVKMLIEGKFIKALVTGEVSTFSAPVSGHWYFTLKDETAQVRCAMFRQSNQRYQQAYGVTKLKQGDSIIVAATATLYPARGDYQLVVSQVHPIGLGYLQQQLELLKAKLSAEGLMDARHKKPIPKTPKVVGVVTSGTGAALYDVIHVLHRRDPNIHIIIYPTAVQGKEAGQQIAAAIATANRRKECEVLIVGRGGGSLEDLWCFNEEIVARAIFSSQIPIVSAVGHEVDFTLSDQIADLRAATPSAAAETLSQAKEARETALKTALNQLLVALDFKLTANDNALNQALLQLRCLHPLTLIQTRKARVEKAEYFLKECFKRKFFNVQQRLINASVQTNKFSIQAFCKPRYALVLYALERLKTLTFQKLDIANMQLAMRLEQLQSASPAKLLAKGYSCIRDDNGYLIKSIKQLNVGKCIRVKLPDGVAIAKITSM